MEEHQPGFAATGSGAMRTDDTTLKEYSRNLLVQRVHVDRRRKGRKQKKVPERGTGSCGAPKKEEKNSSAKRNCARKKVNHIPTKCLSLLALTSKPGGTHTKHLRRRFVSLT